MKCEDCTYPSAANFCCHGQELHLDGLHQEAMYLESRQISLTCCYTSDQFSISDLGGWSRCDVAQGLCTSLERRDGPVDGLRTGPTNYISEGRREARGCIYVVQLDLILDQWIRWIFPLLREDLQALSGWRSPSGEILTSPMLRSCSYSSLHFSGAPVTESKLPLTSRSSGLNSVRCCNFQHRQGVMKARSHGNLERSCGDLLSAVAIVLALGNRGMFTRTTEPIVICLPWWYALRRRSLLPMLVVYKYDKR